MCGKLGGWLCGLWFQVSASTKTIVLQYLGERDAQFPAFLALVRLALVWAGARSLSFLSSAPNMLQMAAEVTSPHSLFVHRLRRF